MAASLDLEQLDKNFAPYIFGEGIDSEDANIRKKRPSAYLACNALNLRKLSKGDRLRARQKNLEHGERVHEVVPATTATLF